MSAAQPPSIAEASSLAIFALALVIVGIVLKRILDAMSARRGFPAEVADLAMRLYEAASVVAFLLAAVLTFFPEYWGMAALVIALLIAFFVLMAGPLRAYTSFVSIRMSPGLRGRYYELLLPGHDRPVHGRIASVNSYYTSVQDALGREALVPNRLLAEAVLRPAQPALTYRLRVRLSSSSGALFDVEQIIREATRALEELEHPAIKRDKRLLLSEVGEDFFELTVTVYPLSIPLRWSDVNDLSLSFYEALSKLGEGGVRPPISEVRIELVGAA
ncbi:MAG: hypothetical protein ABWK00_00740 [Desulfurococcaceae archaeon]